MKSIINIIKLRKKNMNLKKKIQWHLIKIKKQIQK